MIRIAARDLDDLRLPKDLTASGPARHRLLQTLFEGHPDLLDPALSRTILAQFVQTPDVSVFAQRSPELNGIARLLKDLTALEKAFQHCPPEHLEERLRTGIDEIPTRPLELPLPPPDETPTPEPPADLLRALENEGGELAQVAGLVRRMSAILHVPKAVTQREELPLGGVSDITNRGDPSRLLMTELAWDDLTFAVRLAQGAALYLRRESPPAEPPPRRLILIDTGIFMWGKPRLFALGAALALLRQKRGEQAATSTVFTLDDTGFQLITLDSVETVRAQLTRLRPAPHPGHALALLAEDESAPFKPDEEVFLITHPAAQEALCHLPVWQRLASSVPLHTLLVDREGHLSLTRHSLAGTRPLAQARVDAEDLFDLPLNKPNPTKPSPAALTNEAGRLPQFYRQRVTPLLHPAPPAPGKVVAIDIKGYLGVSTTRKKYLGVSTTGCVCLWSPSAELGRVLMYKMPADELMLVALEKSDPNFVHMAFRNRGVSTVELGLVSLENPECHGCFEVDMDRSDTFLPCLNSGHLVVHLDDRTDAYHILDESVKVATVSRSTMRGWPVYDGGKFHPPVDAGIPCQLLKLAKQLPTQHSPRQIIRHIEAVALGSTGKLMIRTEGSHVYRLDIHTHGFDWVGCRAPQDIFQKLQAVAMPSWQDRSLSIAIFPDGRRVVHDPLGFLHVCDSGDEADEISITLVKGHTVVWTRNDKYYGEPNLLDGKWPAALAEGVPLIRKLFRPCEPSLTKH